MNIPLNGRIAIIDDKIDQAEPLMRVLSKNQLPYVFYKGNDIEYLPDDNTGINDIRILFLDINLLDDTSNPSEKQIRSLLIGVLKKVISPNNFPYSLIFWSRHQEEHKELIKGLFDNELKDRKPISYNAFVKSDYFPNFSTEEVDTNVDLIEKLKEIINSQHAYSYLLNWENSIHLSADKTLQEVFSSYPSFTNWDGNANFLINNMGISYSGGKYKVLTPTEKLKSSFNAFNYVFSDALEFFINSRDIPEAVELEYKMDDVDEDSIFTINRKLLLSLDKLPFEYSGAVVEDLSGLSDKVFGDLLNNSISREVIKRKVYDDANFKDKSEDVLKKEIDNRFKSLKKSVKGSYKKIYFVVTPLCDYVQNKFYNIRIVKGFLLPVEFLEFIDDKSEAIFISPKFKFEEKKYVIVLNFRYFFTHLRNLQVKNINSLFRVRQNLLSEVQSKLSRHVNRQGILFLDDRYK